MKKTPKTKQILDESDFDGPMMLYKPMTKAETEKVAAWVAKRKAKFAGEKKSKSKV
jgi:hypothetical protein